jgi:hypothetical protein
VLVLGALLVGGGWMFVRGERAIDAAKTRIAAVDLALGRDHRVRCTAVEPGRERKGSLR